MGFVSTISGFIVTTDAGNARDCIDQLPRLKDDCWPFLPAEIFAVAPASPTLQYKDHHIIHFGMAVKEIETEFSAWLDKFESFFKTMPGTTEAMVILGSETIRSEHPSGRFIYHWKRKNGAMGQTVVWEFSGDERVLFQ